MRCLLLYHHVMCYEILLEFVSKHRFEYRELQSSIELPSNYYGSILPAKLPLPSLMIINIVHSTLLSLDTLQLHTVVPELETVDTSGALTWVWPGAGQCWSGVTMLPSSSHIGLRYRSPVPALTTLNHVSWPHTLVSSGGHRTCSHVSLSPVVVRTYLYD